MSISVTKHVNISQAALKFLVEEEIADDEPVREWKTRGEVLSNSDYAWISNGARLQVINTKTGNKMGSWSFGWILKDSNTEIICVQEIQRPNGRLPLLAIGIDCDYSGGIVCIFDFITSRVVRAIQIKEKMTSLHVIDAGYDVFTLPGPLRNFDGIIAVGAAGGDVYLVDICRQICDEALTVGGLHDVRDELNPSLLFNITSRDLGKIEHHKEFAVRNSQHLAIHLNVVFDKSTKHFTLKGPKGDDRIHVNKDEVAVSALYYCPQLGSLLVGYNFGALQLYNLMNLELVYTSPVWDEHIPISHFSIQEPVDDPKAVCYIWAIYSIDEEYTTCLPLAVMYAFCYQTKEYHEGYGCLYQDFSNASVQYQMELGVPFEHNRMCKQRGGNCLKIKSLHHGLSNREGLHHESNDDNFTLCAFVWNVWFNNKKTETFLAIFDLNQWYKEQMPNVPNPEYYSTYLLQLSPNELINSATNKSAPLLDIHIVENSIQQFTGVQRLEEHFYPNSLTFGIICFRDSDVIFLRNYGVQKALLAQIESSGPLCLVEPALIYQEIVGLGLVPLFVDLPINAPITTNQQREIILGAALENHLIGWLCKCASEWANGSFLSAGCSLDLLMTWAFQRAITLKTNCDNFCTPLFDYSGIRLDNNTNMLLNRCRRQLKNLCSLYAFIIHKLSNFISNHALVEEQFKSLETVCIYFEVLQWLLNVGLLPECPVSSYPRLDDLERISAPYPSEMLAEFYNHRRALLQILNQENFSSAESVLFIDALIERECGGKILQEEWRNDGGNGLYPPPSLQALLRTYLIDDVNLFYKHSVIIYVFLDLAMTLDQERYKLVITQLIKFPAVFKVSPSVIKITQGFWQLDHCDFNTAMALLLDPLVSSNDLTQWHHTIILRALILQKQHNFALYYVQVRKPVLKEDGDVLTAISLYVANNMIDEAFYFIKNFDSHTEEKLLFHLFNECKKNEKLRSLIYRSLNSSDEKVFLQYLKGSNELVAEDLQVYHHILRSHFIEAFECHNQTVPNHLENQGLFGQENAIPRDKLVSCLKKLLLGFSRGLPDLFHKEKRNIWQQVAKPTAMSVTVHDFPGKVHYKSTAFGTDFGKAQQKFEMDTQRTPFSHSSPFNSRTSNLIITPKVLDVDVEITDSSAPPSKRLKVTQRLSTSLSGSIPSKLETPRVKRKTPNARNATEELKATTPHSILKVKSFINQATSQKDEEFKDDFNEFEKLEYTPVNTRAKKTGLGLSPRKSLLKSSPVVRFEGLKRTSSSSLNNSLEKSPSLRPAQKLSLSPIKSNDIRQELSSKNTSTEEDVFYSPNSSLEKEEHLGKEVTIPLRENNQEIDTTQKLTPSETCSADVSVNDINAEIKLNSNPVFSPKGRRSYRRSLQQVTPIRSSPRLSRNLNLTKGSLESPPVLVQKEEPESSNVPSEEPETVSEKSSPAKSKLRPRKSLCRQVLETNTLSRALYSPLDSPRTRRSKANVTTVEETTEKIILESTKKYQDGEEKQQSSLIKKRNLTTSFAESDLSSSSDYSFEYRNVELPKLSDSMVEYLNRSDRNVFGNDGILEELNSNEVPKRGTDASERVSNIDVSSATNKEDNAVPLESNATNDELETNKKENVVDPERKVLQNKSTAKSADVSNTLQDANVSLDVSSGDKSVAYSVLNSSAGEVLSISSSYDTARPKLSKSMADYIKGRENVSTTQNEDEVMEVDDDGYVEAEENKTERDKTTDEPVYATLTTSKTENRNTTMELVYEKKNKEKDNVESCVGDSANHSPVDPEMNVFEISDDLSFNDGILIEREITMEENDLCYGQQNTLEIVLEDNIATSSPMNALEKNVFDASFNSDESDDEEEIQEEPHLEHKRQYINMDKNKDKENEVIEIGSSSEDEENHSKEVSSTSDTQTSSSSSSDSDDDDQHYTCKRNIYESESFDSNHRYSHLFHRTTDIKEIKENSDEEQLEKTKEGCGLFEGEILFEEDQKKDNKSTDETNQKKLEPELEKAYTDEGKEEKNEEVSETVQIYEGLDEDMEQTINETREKLSKSPEVVENNEEAENAPSFSVQVVKIDEDTQNLDKSDVSVEMDELNYAVVEETRTEQQEEVSAITYINTELNVEAEDKTQNVAKNQNEVQLTEQVSKRSIPLESIDNLEVEPQKDTNGGEVKVSFSKGTEPSKEDSSEQLQTANSEKPAEKVSQQTVSKHLDFSNLPHEQKPEDIEEDVLPVPSRRQTRRKKNKDEMEQDALKTLSLPSLRKMNESEIELDALETLSHHRHSKINEDEIKQDALETSSHSRLGKINEAEIEQDALETLSHPRHDKINEDEIEQDALETLSYQPERRQRSASASTSTPTKSSKKSKGRAGVDAINEVFKRRTRRSTDTSEKLEETTEKHIKNLEPFSEVVRTLRSRRISVEEPKEPSRTVSLRKRSASVDEVISDRTQSTNKEVESESQKSRSRRATSVVNLPQIPEEKKTVEDYTINRRVTRQQVMLLQKAGITAHMDPVVVLDRMQQLDDSLDLDEQNKSSSSAKRRTRSASQPVETSRRSKSKTPVRNLRGSRKGSTDEENHAKPSTSKKNLQEPTDDTKEDTPARATRSRTTSVSSINSEDTVASDTSQLGKRRRKVLPQIPEESNISEKSTVPKKRTRQNSSQI